MRRVLEQSFGVATGSSGSLHTGTYLQINGLKGQHIVDERCWIVKSHHPTRTPKVLQFHSDKALCVVRNPLDVIVSFATLCNTLSHSAVLDFNFAKDYPEWWNWWVKHQTDRICKYYDILFADCIEDKDGKGKKLNPIHFSRFEDLCDEPIAELTSMMKFTLGMDDLSGTNMERRIGAIRDMGEKATDTYKLKEHSKLKQFNTKRSMFTDDQFKYVSEKLEKWNWYFGYVKHDNNDRTGFFEYKDPKPEHVESFKAFRANNEEKIKELASGKKFSKYHINGPETETYDSFVEDELLTVQYPARHYA
jgi:hypothetical protein